MIRRGDSGPTVSVIVTNFNYGHFLGSCIDSVAAQTSAPDEIIVVDDGSADGSVSRLEGRSDIRLIEKANGGQASAFNAGFAASRGDVTVFLDADDLLTPDAVETIRRLWSPASAVHCWQLGLIDADGHPAGNYPTRVPEHDQWRGMLRSLGLRFMPTSGNAFTRDAIAWAFPLPEARWRICADALLIRCAMLKGPVRPLPHSLGQYRLHGHNRHFRDEEESLAQIGAEQTDRAEAGLALVALADRGRLPLPPELRLALLRAAVVAWSGGRIDSASAAKGFLRRIMAQWPVRLGLRGVFVLGAQGLSGLAAGRVRPLPPAVVAPVADSGIAARMMQSAGRVRQIDRPSGRCGATSVALPSAVDAGGLRAFCEGPGWSAPMHGGRAVGRFGAALDILRIDATPALLTLELSLSPETSEADVEISHRGKAIRRERLFGPASITLALPAQRAIMPETDRIGLRILRARRLTRAFTGAGGPRHDLLLTGFSLKALVAERHGAVLPVGRMTGFAPLAATAWVERGIAAAVPRRTAVPVNATEKGGGRSMLPPALRVLSLAAPPLPAPFALTLTCAADQAAGFLVLTLDGAVLFRGQTGPGRRITAAVPAQFAGQDATYEIVVAFRPDDTLDDARLQIARIGWMPGPPVDGAGDAPVLVPGGWIAPGDTSMQSVLGAGWTLGTVTGPMLEGGTADLRLGILACGADAPLRLALDLELAAPLPAAAAMVLAVSFDGGAPWSTRFLGEGMVEVPVPPGPSRIHAVTVHALVAPDGERPDPAARHPGLCLRGIGLIPDTAQPAGDTDDGASAAPLAALIPPVSRLLGALSDALAAGTTAALLPLCQSLHAELAQLAPNAALALIDSDALRVMTNLDHAVGAGDRGLPDPGPPPGGPGEWVRWLALAILSRGPEARGAIRADSVPEMTRGLIGPVADWLVLTAAGAEGIAAEADAARSLVCAWPRLHPLRLAGEAVIRAMTPTRLAHSGGMGAPDACAAAGRAIAALLAAEGHVLPLVAPPQPGMAVRAGLLLRDGDAPLSDIEPVIRAWTDAGHAVTMFSTDGCSDPAALRSATHPGLQHVRLAGLGLGAAVTALRETAPDILVIADQPAGWDRLTTLAAHRLAPRQVVLAPGGLATGLGSCDAALRPPEIIRMTVASVPPRGRRDSTGA